MLRGKLTGSPQHLALALEAGAHSAVAAGGAFLAGLPVLQEDVGRAVGGAAGAVLREVALSERLPTHPATRTQLEDPRREGGRNRESTD